MQIIGFNLDKISAEKKKEITGKLEIKSNIDIKDVEQDKLEVVKEKDVLKFGFSFSLNYEPGYAHLIFEGKILLLVDKVKSKEVLKKWKTKKLDDEIRIPLFNFILNKCSLRALQMEDELGIPTHIALPRIKQEEGKGYVQ
jgi:hypothetical protein